MRKLLAILIAFCSAFLITGLAACEDDIDHSGSEVIIGGDLSGYNIHPDLSDFSDVVELNGVVHYEDIKLNCAKLHATNDGSNKYHAFIVEVREDMIVSIDSTDTVGDKKLVIAYAGRELVISFTVKYKVSFLSMGEVFDTQYVLTPEEIQFPNPPKQEGYTFANYWETEVPEELTDNMQFEAHYYVNAFEAPKLETVELTYDPNATVTIGDFALPSNEHGKWVYVEDESTVIEGAGKHLIDVKFIPVNEFVAPKTAQLVVNVAPKHATFEILSNSFVYDGNSYFPEFTVTDGIEVEVLGEAKVEAGTYTYALLVADSNYEGHYSGSFTIAKPDVTITVSSNSMKYAEVMPKLEYSVEGFANEALLDIKLVQPNVISIGNYEITAIVQNKNVNATVINGILTVEKGNLADIPNPTLSTDETPAIYESPISSVAITGDYRGVWTWKNPDLIIDSVESITATAVFTPNNENYNLIEREITITNLDKRTLEITILNSDYVYTGEEFTIEYAIEDGKVVTVEGLIAKTNAGSYKTSLSINDKYYKGTKEVTLFIDKATPVTDFTTNYTKVWNEYLTLSNIVLEDGYTWDIPVTYLNEFIGTKKFAATFTPDDIDNYYSVKGEFSVTVEKAAGVLENVKSSYIFTYNKDKAHVISGITSIPGNGVIKYTYILNGQEVNELKVAGTYQVTVDLLESAYHTSAQATTEVVINKIVNTEVVNREQSAIYGAKLNSLVLPISEFGVWSWKNANESTTVGNAGEHVYTAVYTPNDPDNYESREVDVKVTVIKQTVYEPTVKSQFTYNASEITAFTCPIDALYFAEGDLKATTAGNYTITLTLNDADNYQWSTSINASIEIKYAITQASNEITSLTITGWNYNSAANEPTIEAIFGANTVVYYYAPAGSQNYTTTVPKNAGTYNIRAEIAETTNYAGAIKTITAAFTINKIDPDVEFNESYTVEWYEGLKLSSISYLLPTGFTWKKDASLEVGANQEIAVIYTPTDTVNYNKLEGKFTVTVTKGMVTLSGVQESYSHVYNGSAYTVTGVSAMPNVELVYTYSSGSAPVNAGEYTVTITVKDSAHYTLGTEPDSVVRAIVIAKADVDTVVSYNATYLDTLGSLVLPTSEYGVWTWKEGNDTLVGAAGERKHVAVFTSSSNNYNSIEREFVVNVAKKAISKPTLAENSFVYTGEAITLLGDTDLYTVAGNVQTNVGNYTITVSLKDAENYVWSAESLDPTFAITQAPNTITTLAVEGWTYGDEAKAPSVSATFGASTVVYYYAPENTQSYTTRVPTNAGTYNIKAVIAETANYAGAERVLTAGLTIAKATLNVAFDKHYTETWYNGIKLSNIALEAGYAWKNADTVLEVGAEQEFAVVYTPNDTVNYNVEEGTFKVTVNRRVVTLSGVQESYSHVYNGTAYTVSGVTAMPNVELVYTYSSGSAPVNAGEYTVTITVKDSAHYTLGTEPDSVVRAIVIAKADVDTVASYNATYLDTLGSLALPTSEYGVWTWKEGNDTLVGAAGERKHVAVFTSSSNNYNSIEREFVVNVAKKAISKPTLTENSFVYTGEAITLLGDTDLYTVAGNVQTNVGNYTITVSLKDTENYVWSAESVDPTFAITKATTEIKNLSIEGWTYGEEAKAPTAETNFGTIKYLYAGADEVYSEIVPTNVGSYFVKAVVAGNDNYISCETEAISFAIAKAEYTLALAKESYTVDWFDGITLAAITNLPEGYSWTNANQALVAGTTAIKYGVTYVDLSGNYNPAYGEFEVTVNRLGSSITVESTFGGNATEEYTHVYNGSAFEITASASHTEENLVYTVNGEVVSEISLINVGEYEVVITLAQSEHYLATSWSKTVVIKQARATYTLPAWAPGVESTIGDLASPTVNETLNGGYSWVWMDENAENEVDINQKVGGAAKTVHYTLRFISNDPNYESFDVKVAITVGKIMVTPTLEQNTFTYTGETFTVTVLGIDTDVEYTVAYLTDFINKGDHVVEITMSAESYKTHSWTGSTTASITLPVVINASVNTVESVTIAGWTYGETASVPSTVTKFGGEVTYSHYNVNNRENIIEGIPSDAGTYVLIATSAETTNYASASKESAEFTIAQATPEAPSITTEPIAWFEGITLADVVINSEECVWVDETQAIGVGENQIFKATYMPDDSNYHAMEVELKVTVNKARAEITGVLVEGYTHTYNDQVYELSGIGRSHTESELAYLYTLNGVSVEEIKGAGTYTVTITLAESEHYNEETATTVVTVEQATNAWAKAPSISSAKWTYNTQAGVASAEAKFGTVITEYRLQSASEYVSEMPVNAGEYFVRFRVVGNNDYSGLTSSDIAFVIEQAVVTASIIDAENFVYNGEAYTASVSLSVAGVDYAVSGNTQSDAGTHEVTVTLNNANYKFANGTNVTVVTFVITASVNTVESVTIAGWTYGETASEPHVETKFGGDVSYKYYNVNNPENIIEGLPSNAGTYVLIATSSATANYERASMESAQFTIAKATPNVAFNKHYTVTWESGLKLSNIALETGYAWKVASTELEVGENQVFAVVYTPNDTANYNVKEGSFTVTVNRAIAEISGVQESYTHTYNGQAYKLSGITASHDEKALAYSYTLNGVSVEEIKGVGTYTVTITLAESEHYNKATETTVVTVEQATNTWTKAPSISSAEWTYNTQAGVASAEAKFGTVITEYRLQSASEYVSEMPVNAGEYFVRFRVVGNNDYSGLTSSDIAFVIEQAVVTASIIDAENFVYNGEAYTASVSLSVAGVDYVVSGNTQTNAGTHKVTVTLNNANYAFADGKAQTVLEFAIAVGTNTVESVTIAGWTYGEAGSEPQVETKFGGDVSYKYYNVNNPETIIEGMPSNAGTYVLIATSSATANYASASSESAEFTIEQSENYTLEVTVNDGNAIIWYNGLTLASVQTLVGINSTQAGNWDWDLAEGENASEIALAVGDNKYNIVFTPNSANYKAKAVEVTIKVDPIKVDLPANTVIQVTDGTNTVSGNPAYNGKVWSVVGGEGEGYTYSSNGTATNAGDQITVTFTLTDKEHTVWDVTDPSNADQSVVITVQKAENTISNIRYENGNIVFDAPYKDEDKTTYYYKVDSNADFTEGKPMQVGTYEVKVEIAESDNYLSASATGTITITSSKIFVGYTLSQTEAVYTGSDITVTVTLTVGNVADNTVGFTINGEDTNTFTVNEAKDYTITLKLTNADYAWENGTDTLEFTFTVNPAENGWANGEAPSDLITGATPVTDTTNAFSYNYNGNEVKVRDLEENETWTKFGTTTITYQKLKDDGTVEKTFGANEYPKDAGNYKIIFDVPADGNNYAAISLGVSLIIKAVETEISTLPTYTAQLLDTARDAQAQDSDSGYKYATAPKATVKGTTTEVTGTFEYGEITFNRAGGASSTYTLTFTPDDPNYGVSTATVTINLIDVAYHTTDGGTTRSYYGSLVDALNDEAIKSGEIWVVPNATGKINHDVVIDENVEVKSSVTLILPYGTKGSEVKNSEGKADPDMGNSNEFVLTERDTCVIIKEGCELIVNGTLEIAGRVSANYSGAPMAGHTYKEYAELELKDGAKVIVNKVIKITGFITGENGEVITNNGSTIYMPFVYGDHHGGTYLTTMKGNSERVSPFNRYQFRNIRNATLRMNYGSEMIVYANLAYSIPIINKAQVGYTTAEFIGNSGVLELTSEYSYFTAKFNPETSICNLDIYGTAQTNNFTLKLNAAGSEVSVSSKDFDFPIPWNYHITLNKIADNTDAKNGQFTMNATYKLLPGAKITVNKGAVLNLNTMMVYTEINLKIPPYTVNYYDEKYVDEDAIFTVNGELNVTGKFGGVIYTNTPGAKVTITTPSVEMYNVSGYDHSAKKVYYQKVTKTLELEKSGNADEVYNSAGTYYSDGSAWYTTGTKTISYDSTGGEAVVNKSFTVNAGVPFALTGDYLPEITRNYYTFEGWYDKDGNKVEAGKELYGDITLYAKWIAKTYTVNYVSDKVSTADAETFAYTEAKASQAIPSLTDPDENYTFIGWYLAEDFSGSMLKNYGEALSVAEANGQLSITVYAKWSGGYAVSFNVNPNNDAESDADTATYNKTFEAGSLEELKAQEFPSAVPNTTKMIFLGWYVNLNGVETKVTNWSFVDSLTAKQIEVYAKWEYKYALTVTESNSGATAGTKIEVTGATYYFETVGDANTKLIELNGTVTAQNANTATNVYFVNWTDSNGNVITSIADNSFTDKKLTINANWGNKVSFTVTTSNATVTIAGSTVSNDATVYHVPGSITIGVSYSESDNQSIAINGGPCTNAGAGTYTFSANDKVTVNASSSAGCFTGDTLITLADGSQKRVDELKANDYVLVFDHMSGENTVMTNLFIINRGYGEHELIKLYFDDGTIFDILYGHGIFDYTTSKYEMITAMSVAQYIDHEFAIFANGVNEKVRLIGYEIGTIETTCYSLMTPMYINHYANGLLCVSDGIDGLFNYFEYDSEMKYDETQMQADIEKYGLYTYEEWADVFSYEEFIALNVQYGKIAIAKGLMTYDDIFIYIDKYLTQFRP